MASRAGPGWPATGAQRTETLLKLADKYGALVMVRTQDYDLRYNPRVVQAARAAQAVSAFTVTQVGANPPRRGRSPSPPPRHSPSARSAPAHAPRLTAALLLVGACAQPEALSGVTLRLSLATAPGVFVVSLWVLCVLLFAVTQTTPFIYFQF